MLSAQLLFALCAVSARAASLVPVQGIVPNPNNVLINFYEPDVVAASPALLVALHDCTGSASEYYTDTKYASLADQRGFIVLYPQSPRSGTCWDVGSAETLIHDAGGDSLGVASAVRYALTTYSIDPSRVFVTGSGSGAVFTNVLLGAYPDLFQGGSAFAGAPYGCYAGGTYITWNSACATGQVSKTPQEWGDLVRSAYPGYSGPRPKVQVWHGSGDGSVYAPNFFQEIKQWTNVLGYTQTPISNITDQPECLYYNATFGPDFQAIYAQQTVRVPVHEVATLEFFGLGDALNPSATTTLPNSVTATSTSACGTPTAYAQLWAQCGGVAFTGPFVCAKGSVCTYSNPYFSQCLPAPVITSTVSK